MRRVIAEAGLDPEKTELALKILRQIAINPALPKGQRLSDETYRELLKPDPPAGEGCPPEDTSNPPEDEDSGLVLPFTGN